MVNSTGTYKLFAEYYDLYVGKFCADLDFYKSFCNITDEILEIGCGTGRILSNFLKNGFKITGIDISQEMLEIAHEKLGNYEKSGQVKLINFNLEENYFPEKFDKAFITFYTFNYIIDKPLDFLKNVSESIKDDGLLLIDLFYPKAYSDKTSDNRWTEHALSIDNRNILIKDKRKVISEIEYRTQVYSENGKEITIETERIYYSPDAIKRLLQLAGFKEISFSIVYDKNYFSPDIDQNKLKSNFLVFAKK